MSDLALAGLAEVCRLIETRTAMRINGADRAANMIRLESARDSIGCTDWTQLARKLHEEDLTGHTWTALIQAVSIGETYFFRNKPQMDLLREEVLPALIEQRRRDDQPWLRVWSAGCSTGEEAYSVAIQVSELIPDRRGWAITILGTDLNPESLRRARSGAYGRWSFRDNNPEVMARHSARRGDRVVIDPDIRSMVTFSRANLVDDEPYGLRLSAMDVILCRNVTMYFNPDVRKAIAQRMLGALRPGGWLLVGPSEPDAEIYAGFDVVAAYDACAYRRPLARLNATQSADRPAAQPDPLPFVVPEPDKVAVERSKARGPSRSITSGELLHAARIAADAGRYAEARDWCNRALDIEATGAEAFELLGMIYAAEDRAELAVEAFRKAIYLESDLAVAHYGLSTELRALGDEVGAERAAETVRHLLRSVPEHRELRGTSGMTAGDLRDLIGPDARALLA